MLCFALIAIDNRDYEDAEPLLRQALRIEKTAGRCCQLGVSLRNLGRDAETEASYREALAIDPNFDEAYGTEWE
jgi:Flp pilus assembly protein TadD